MARETNDCHVTIILAGAAELLVFTFPKVFAWISADLYAALSGKYFVFCNGACDVCGASWQAYTQGEESGFGTLMLAYCVRIE